MVPIRILLGWANYEESMLYKFVGSGFLPSSPLLPHRPPLSILLPCQPSFLINPHYPPYQATGEPSVLACNVYPLIALRQYGIDIFSF